INIVTPVSEYSNFTDIFYHSDLYLSDNYFSVILKYDTNSDKFYIRNTLFTNNKLLIYLVGVDKKDLENFRDENKNNLNLRFGPEDYKKTITKLTFLDSSRENFSRKFYSDLKVSDSLFRNSVFLSNKEFFKLHKNFLS